MHVHPPFLLTQSKTHKLRSFCRHWSSSGRTGAHITACRQICKRPHTGCQITSARNGEGYRGRPQTQQNIAFDESRRQIMPKADRMSEGIYDVCKTEKGHILPPLHTRQYNGQMSGH